MTQGSEMLTVVTTRTTKSTQRGVTEEVRKIVEQGVPLDTLQQNFVRFLSGLQRMVAVGQSRVGEFALDEITFSAEIGVDGEFKLLGSGLGASVTSGVTFTLRHQPLEKPSGAQTDAE